MTKTFKEKFNTLNNLKHTETQKTVFCAELFETKNPTTQSYTMPEYWYASDLLNIIHPDLGNSTTDLYNFASINLQCIRDKEILKQHIENKKQSYTLGNHTYENATDYKMSPFACWCATNNKPNLVFENLYFMSSVFNKTLTLAELVRMTNQIQRIYARQETINSQNTVSNTIHKLLKHKKYQNLSLDEIQKQNTKEYKKMNFIIYKAFFGNNNQHNIKEAYNLQNVDLFDYIGINSLNLFINAVSNAIKTTKHKRSCSALGFQKILVEKIADERKKLLEQEKERPEFDIQQKSVQEIEQEYKKYCDIFIAQQNQKLI